MYFHESKEISSNIKKQPAKFDEKMKNNEIINLKYEVKFDKNRFYEISSLKNELIYLNENEIIKMNGVIAKIIDKNKSNINIKSDEAIYDRFSSETKFRKNVEITYEENKINSDKIDLDFANSTIKIYENVKYTGKKSVMTTDIIIIDIINNKVEILMNNSNKNIKISENK